MTCAVMFPRRNYRPVLFKIRHRTLSHRGKLLFGVVIARCAYACSPSSFSVLLRVMGRHRQSSHFTMLLFESVVGRRVSLSAVCRLELLAPIFAM